MNRIIAACLLPAVLAGCAATGGISALQGIGGQLPGTAAGLFGIPAATISIQFAQEVAGIQSVAAQLQMLKAQLDGNIPIIPSTPIPTPTIVNPIPTPVVVGTPITPPAPMPPPPPTLSPPGGPIVTPNVRHSPSHQGRLQIPATTARIQEEWEHSGRPFTGAVAAR